MRWYLSFCCRHGAGHLSQRPLSTQHSADLCIISANNCQGSWHTGLPLPKPTHTHTHTFKINYGGPESCPKVSKVWRLILKAVLGWAAPPLRGDLQKKTPSTESDTLKLFLPVQATLVGGMHKACFACTPQAQTKHLYKYKCAGVQADSTQTDLVRSSFFPFDQDFIICWPTELDKLKRFTQDAKNRIIHI